MLAFVLARHGFELVLAFCALGGCGKPKNEGLGWAFVFAGVACLILGIVVSVRLSVVGHRVARALLAVPVVTAIGLVTLVTSLPDLGGWGQNVSLFALVVGFVGVLVPPQSGWWSVGTLAGGLVTAVLGDSVWLGLVSGTAVFLAAIGIMDVSLDADR